MSIAVIDSDLDSRERLHAALAKLGPSAFTSLDAFQTDGTKVPTWSWSSARRSPTEPGWPRPRSSCSERRDVAMVLVVETLSTETLQQALRAGMRDVITVPRSSRPAQEAIGREHRRRHGRPAGVAAPVESAADQPCRLITVFSTKGGSGKSVIACNLAVVLASAPSAPSCWSTPTCSSATWPSCSS